MLNSRILLLCVMVSLLLLVPAAAAQEADSTDTPYEDRRFHLYVPDALPDNPDLIVALHSSASSGEALAGMSGLNALADRMGALVVYPQALDMIWQDGRQNQNLQVPLGDDVGFVQHLIGELGAEYGIAETYAVGWRGGGVMAYWLACEIPQAFSAVAVVGALMWEFQADQCAPAEAPLDLLVIHGTADPVYTPGGADFNGQIILGVGDTMEFWAARNGCAVDAFNPSELYPNVREMQDCEHRLAYYGVAGGSGDWPRVGDYVLNTYGVDATAMLGNFFAGEADWPVAQAAPYEDYARTFTPYVPSGYDAATPTPLVFVLHGRPGNGTGIAYITDMNRVAEAHGFIAVYPDGLNQQWNYVRNLPLYDPPEYDDFAFIAGIIEDMAQDFAIDRQRIYVTGFSNGGFMTQRLACQMPETFAAFAAVGSAVFSGLPEICPQRINVPMLLMHGTRDVSIPWDGVPTLIGTQPLAFSVNGTMTFWTTRNNCRQDTAITEVPAAGRTEVRILEVVDCPEGAAVVLYGIMGGGHNWPGVPERISQRIAGDVNMDIFASEVVWDFFSQYSLDD